MQSENQNREDIDIASETAAPRSILKVILRGGLVAFCAVIFALGASWVGNKADILSPLKQALDSYKLSDFYFWAHKSSRRVSYNGTSVVTLDISGCHDRMEIAEVINKVNSANPRVVAIDIVFPDISKYVDKAANDSLVSALKRTRNLVLAREYRPLADGKYSINPSFFENEVDATIGAATLPIGIIRDWTPVWVLGNDTIPSLAKAIADVAGIPVSSATSSRIIDYSINDGMIIKANSIWDAECLEDQIVLIGDMDDLRDSHVIPLTLNRSIKQAGMIIHRQILQTIMQGKERYTVPKWLVVLVTYLTLWALFVIKEYYKNSGAILRRFLSKSHNRFIAYIIAFYDKIKPDLLRLAIMCGAIICGYLLLWATGILFEFKLLMSGYVALYIVEGIDNDITEFNARMKNTLDDNNK